MKKVEYFLIDNVERVSKDILNSLYDMGISSRREIIIDNPALIILDAQNYFFSENSHAFIPAANAIKNNIIQLINLFLKKNLNVFFTRHSNDINNAGMMNIKWRDLIDKNSTNYQLIDELKIFTNISIIEKNQYDAFYNTNLEEILNKNNIKTLIFAGVATNLCCETTVRSAFVRGFRPYLPIDACATFNYELHKATFINLAHGFTTPVLSSMIIEGINNA